MISQLIRSSLILTLIFTLITGLIYPLALTAISQMLFLSKANGSLIKVNGKTIGSKLIGQRFLKPEYFHPRPSQSNFDGLLSGGSNLGPTSKKLIERVQNTINLLQTETQNQKVPPDLAFTSGSGLDPHISPEAAFFQAERVANVRGITKQKLNKLINKHVEKRQLGFLGEPRVNVLELNIDLDKLSLSK